MNKAIIKYAVYHALATGAYIVLIGLFFKFAPFLFGDEDKSFFTPIAMLLLLVFSAALTGSIVFGRPVLWFLEGKKKQALELFIYTLGSIFVLMLIAFLILFIVSR